MDPRHDALYLSKDVDGMYYEIRRQRAEIEQLRRSMGRCSEGSDMTTETAALVRQMREALESAMLSEINDHLLSRECRDAIIKADQWLAQQPPRVERLTHAERLAIFKSAEAEMGKDPNVSWRIALVLCTESALAAKAGLSLKEPT